MSCTAILVNYFSTTDIVEAVESLLNDDPNLNVIVIDNSCSIFESDGLSAALPAKVKVLVSAENLGFGRACNWAVQVCDSEFLFLVNPDARVLSGCTAQLIEQLETSHNVCAVAPMQYLDDACHWMLPPNWFPTEVRAWAAEVALRDRDVAYKLSRAYRKEAIRYWTAISPIRQRSLSGGLLMIRRTAVDTSKLLFDPRFFMYFEDSDFCRRLKRLGFTFAMVPSAKGVHRWRNQAHKNKLMAESAVLYFDKYASANDHWRDKYAALIGKKVLMPSIEDSVIFPAEGVDLIPGKWLFELSPSPLMSPAIARIVESKHLNFPADVLGNFEGAPLFARIAPLAFSLSEDDNRLYRLN